MHRETSQVNISSEECVRYGAVNGYLSGLADTIHGFADTIVLDNPPFDVSANLLERLAIQDYIRISSMTIHEFANTLVGNFQSFLPRERPITTIGSKQSAIPENMTAYQMDNAECFSGRWEPYLTRIQYSDSHPSSVTSFEIDEYSQGSVAVEPDLVPFRLTYNYLCQDEPFSDKDIAQIYSLFHNCSSNKNIKHFLACEGILEHIYAYVMLPPNQLDLFIPEASQKIFEDKYGKPKFQPFTENDPTCSFYRQCAGVIWRSILEKEAQEQYKLAQICQEIPDGYDYICDYGAVLLEGLKG